MRENVTGNDAIQASELVSRVGTGQAIARPLNYTICIPINRSVATNCRTTPRLHTAHRPQRATGRFLVDLRVLPVPASFHS